MKPTKIQFILFGILLAGLILRIIAVYNVDIEADELVISTRAINFISAKRLSTIDQEPLYHYLTDLGYKLLGVNALSTRLAPLISSLLSILLVFYIAKEFFNKKIALVASSFLAINHFYIRFMLEPDIVAGFFALLGTFLFIKWIKGQKTILLYATSLSIALGILNKPTIAMIVFAFAYLFIVAIIKKEIKLNWKLAGKICIAIIIFMISLTPIFAYNYLLFKEKGITDILVARFLDINKEAYKGLSGIDDKFVIASVPKGIFYELINFLRHDPLIFPIVLIGALVFLLKARKERKYAFFAIWLFFPFAFIAGSTSVQVHYAILFPFFSILGAYAFYAIVETIKIKAKINLTYPLLSIILLGTIFMMIPTLMENSATIQLRNFAENLPDNVLVITDSRIYTGIIAYAFNDKHYLKTGYWKELLEDTTKLKHLIKNPQLIETYFIECVDDKCGWSDVSGINETTEMIANQMKEAMQKTASVSDKKYQYNIYKTNFNMNPIILDIADTTAIFYTTPIGYKNSKAVDDYALKTAFDKLLNSLAYLIIYLETALAVISAVCILIYFVFQKEDTTIS